MTGWVPFQVRSSRLPNVVGSAPLTVPDANRSPTRRLAPLTVRCASIWAGDQYMSRYSGRADDRAVDPDLEVQVEAERVAVGLALQIGEHGRVLPGQVDLGRRERLERHDPGRDAGRERLAEERSERDVLPGLDVARAPVVEDDDAEEVVARLAHGDRVPRSVGPADHEADLALDVERRWTGPNGGTPSGPGRRCPDGRTTSVPLTTTVPARPW